jgi:hypothetical protein
MKLWRFEVVGGAPALTTKEKIVHMAPTFRRETKYYFDGENGALPKVLEAYMGR